MTTYILRRVIIGVITLWGISVIVFVLIRMMPGDVASMAQLGIEDPKAAAVMAERIRKQYHLDEPIPVQYGMWFSDVLKGNFGSSYQDGRPVVGKIVERLPATASLATLSVLLGLAAAIPLGIVQAVKKVTDIVAEIAAASREQSSGIEQVNKAIMQMDSNTQQNAALVEEAAAASQAIVEQALLLNSVVSHYRIAASVEIERSPRRARPEAAKAPASSGNAVAQPQTAPRRKAAGSDAEWTDF